MPRIVRRRRKYGIEIQDAISEIWVKLLKADILRKFLNSAPRHLPPTITTDEAVEFLGVSWDSWCNMLDTYENAPIPVKGANKDPDSQLDSEAVLALDRAGYFKQRTGLRRLPAGSVTIARFENYLKTAADNHMKNLLRTQDRRFNKEIVQGSVVLSQTGDVFKRSVAIDENTAWEATLRDPTPLVDEVLDGYTIAKKLGVEYDTPEYYQEIENLTQALDTETLSPESGLDVLKLMSEGYSPQEAIAKQREFEIQRQGSTNTDQVQMVG